jgi:ketosteroid isomerase-like protein
LIDLLFLVAAATATPSDHDIVAELDRTYQVAVKRNDAVAMDKILHPQFQLVLGSGQRISRAELIDEARRETVQYDLQDEEAGSQTVMVAGDTAIVTAKLLLKGVQGGRRFERVMWFSDTYVRTPAGWRYLFGQASLPLPTTQEQASAR